MTTHATGASERLHAGLAQLGLTLPPEVVSGFERYLDLLERWNQVFNLTAVRDRSMMVSVHLLDSLAVLPFLVGPRMLDVGTGAGLPGIPIALVRKEWSLTLLDSNSKKCAFVRQAAGELGLGNVTVLERRAEDLAGLQFDTVVSRAFADTGTFVRRTATLVMPAGRWVAMKGVRPDDELAHLPPTVRVVAVESLAVPFLEAERHAVILQSVPGEARP